MNSHVHLQYQQRGHSSHHEGVDRFRLPNEARKNRLMSLLEGRSTQAVATELSISFKTAETHKTRLMSKLGLHSASDLISFAKNLGLFRQS
ncbi:MAG: DNA-binding NarL/FixJ family response regulator [Candidatus Azotimanducaceae bacterium]|jgi:DNA-binding NarL/FixJ family response regulator